MRNREQVESHRNVKIQCTRNHWVPRAGAIGTDFLKRSDLMGGLEKSRGKMD